MDDYYNSTRNIDNFLIVMAEERSQIVEKLINDPVRLIEQINQGMAPYLFLIDRNCLFNMNRHANEALLRIEDSGLVDPLLRRKVKCLGCKLMDRLIDMDSGKTYSEFKIECGKRIDCIMTLKRLVITKFFVDYRPINRLLLSHVAINFEVESCQQRSIDISEAMFLQTSPFINNILQSSYLQHIFESYDIITSSIIYKSFICGTDLFYLQDKEDITDINQFIEMIEDNTVMLEMLIQLFSFLHILKSFDFYPGELTNKTLIFSKNRIKYRYDGINIEANFNTKFANLNRAGITLIHNTGEPIEKTRIYPKILLEEAQLGGKILDGKMLSLVEVVPYSGERKRLFFKINLSPTYQRHIDIINYLQRTGVMIYQASLNCYSFWILLMKNKTFNEMVKNTPYLLDMWHALWLPEEYEEVEQAIVDKKRIEQFLLKFHLRCDSLDYTWTFLKRLFEGG